MAEKQSTSTRVSGLPAYAELHCLSNFSFQRGASHPEELVERAHALGYAALALTDECSVAGVVRAHAELKRLRAEQGGSSLRLLVGSEFSLDGFRLVVLPRHLDGWGNLCEFITRARRRASKGQYRLARADVTADALAGCEVLLAPERLAAVLQAPPADIHTDTLRSNPITAAALWLRETLGHGGTWLAAELLLGPADALWRQWLHEASAASGLPVAAAGDVALHRRSRKPLHDVLTAVRLGRPVAACGFDLMDSAERHLRSRLRLARLYPPEWLAHTLVVASRCTFSLDEIRYAYPRETVTGFGPTATPAQVLAQLTQAGAVQRYPQGVPASVQAQIARELALIADCAYEMYFLTVHDIVRFARSKGILCQGRGSAANSAVCYCLGITEVDPTRSHLLFERFISRERREPPDIDVDFEHERREEVIQYIYAKYGRERAAIAAVVTSYRSRSALRDVGKALDVPQGLIDAFAKDHHWFDHELRSPHDLQVLAATACDNTRAVPPARLLALWLDLTRQLLGFPRHLSQHVGGFVLTEGKLSRLVPIENAAMPERSVIQWDKDDLDEMGLMKVDVLALGMLSAIRRCLHLVGQRRALPPGQPFRLQDIPAECPATYDMICAGDTVGVFQIESRAQMSMLPRLKPRVFYDLVIEVAIVRPGPIAGGMVHPYLKARQRVAQGLDIDYERSAHEPAQGRPALADALQRTLGVPIFQEQVMQIAMIAAGFSGAQADQLRRSMAAWKRKGGVHKFQQPIIDGMLARGYRREFAEAIFQQILGFGEYGFPESHAYSFALLAYASSWLKCHEPACFLAALINSQPMGFYAPAQLVQDTRRHGVVVLPVDVCVSEWDCTLEACTTAPSTLEACTSSPAPAVRLGLRLVAHLGQAAALRIVAAREQAPFAGVDDLAHRAALDRGEVQALAAADALSSLAGHRRQQVWQASAWQAPPQVLAGASVHEATLTLPAPPEGEEIVFDYAATGLTLRRHPLALLRERLDRLKVQTAERLNGLPHGRRVRACGLVTVRQQPQTAGGTVFVTLEDETGPINVIVWKHVRERQRQVLVGAKLLAVSGQWQRDEDSGGQVRHLIARQLHDWTPLLGRLAQQGMSRDFR